MKPLPPSVPIANPTKPTLRERARMFFMRLWWWWTGGVLSTKLADKGSEVRTDAELAVERIVLTTSIAPDCVSAGVLRGGTTIFIKHDGASEAFIGNSYDHAADKAIEWLTKREGQYIVQNKSTELSRKGIKVFDAKRRTVKRQLKEASRARRKHH